jgi:hypothetical protein
MSARELSAAAREHLDALGFDADAIDDEATIRHIVGLLRELGYTVRLTREGARASLARIAAVPPPDYASLGELGEVEGGPPPP